MRDRLIELLDHYLYSEQIADHLIANGVILPPCKVGDLVYILSEKCKFSGDKNDPWNSCNQYWTNVYRNGMWGCAGKDDKGNKIYCEKKEMVWYIKGLRYSLLLYNDNYVLGENLFLTKEDAEKALKEKENV